MSNIEVLSEDEIIAWLKRNFLRGARNLGKSDGGELPNRAFCRAVGLDDGDLSRIISGKEGPLKTRIRVLSRFIRDWENGLLEFSYERRPGHQGGKAMRVLKHLATPKRMPVKFTVELGQVARLRLSSKPAPTYRFPEFRSIIPIDKKA